MRFRNFIASIGLVTLLSPALALAASANSFEVAAWIPYWRSLKGVDAITPHLDVFTEVNPFMYSVATDGSLHEASSLGQAEWTALRRAALFQNIKFIPTIMWSNADAMDTVFRDPALRAAHIRSIAAEVYKYQLDGIDIDYEAKYAKTKDYFSLFLKELHDAIGYDKWIECTIEARTPLDSRYDSPESIPSDIAYANDFKEINKYCDRVRIMAYDQGRIDLKLNKANSDPYVAVADINWVRKVMELAAVDIDRSKLLIGVPTYGYEYDMFPSVNGDGTMSYSRLWSFNPGYASDTAAALNITPTRGSSGEPMLTFPASLSTESIPLPNATRVLVWDDAQAIQQKVDLALELGLRGVAIFKVDGGQDPNMWNALEPYKDKIVNQAVKAPDTTLAAESEGGRPLIAYVMPQNDLEYGMHDTGVKTLQQFLNANGYMVSASGAGSKGSETTYFGPATKKALAAFQQAAGVAPSVGYYGPKTRAFIARGYMQ